MLRELKLESKEGFNFTHNNAKYSNGWGPAQFSFLAAPDRGAICIQMWTEVRLSIFNKNKTQNNEWCFDVAGEGTPCWDIPTLLLVQLLTYSQTEECKIAQLSGRDQGWRLEASVIFLLRTSFRSFWIIFVLENINSVFVLSELYYACMLAPSQHPIIELIRKIW